MTSPIEVSGAVILYRGRVLLTRRGPTSSYPLAWECPGGKLELGETLEEAARREVYEELGLALNQHVPSSVVGVAELAPTGAHRPIRWTAHLFDLSAAPETPPVTLKPPACAAGWFTADELYELPMTPGNGAIFATLSRLCRASAEGR